MPEKPALWSLGNPVTAVREITQKASTARVYDYLCGGGHNFAVDRQFAEDMVKVLPNIKLVARSNRGFLGRAVAFLSRQGIKQFIDIGSGLPMTVGNVHDIADRENPHHSRVVYIDNDPICFAHSEILISKTADPDRHKALHGDYFDRHALWERIAALDIIDFTEPIGLLVVGVMQFLPTEKRPEATLQWYRDRLPTGSYLVLSHGTTEGDSTGIIGTVAQAYTQRTSGGGYPRSRAYIEALFGDFRLVDPGVVWTPEWRPEPDQEYSGTPADSAMLCGVAIKEG